ncbi:MAG: 50S ribosomal protein L13 [Planctomycetales bacterium 4572_13]|nr:MAG: 50S ribosomal protein L13 [Planctomycetales bacterium 4572_13]
MKSFLAKKETVERNWRVIDADGAVLGRLAVKVAVALMGKDKPIYTPHVDTGDFVIVVNAGKVRLTGNKAETKEYQRYSGYPGGQKIIPYKQMIERHPERVVEMAVKRMLPKNTLGAHMYKKLKVYSGPKHDHAAQQPQKMEL